MYNGFGAYPQDDMDMGVSSYFGESDSNFFGDTSNDSFFGEGCGVTGFGNAEFFNESVGFSTDGSEVISEACDYGYGYSDMICEANTTDNVASSNNKKESDSGKLSPATKKEAASEAGGIDTHKAIKRLARGNYSSERAALDDTAAVVKSGEFDTKIGRGQVVRDAHGRHVSFRDDERGKETPRVYLTEDQKRLQNTANKQFERGRKRDTLMAKAEKENKKSKFD